MSPCVFFINLPNNFTERQFLDAPAFHPWKVRVLRMRIGFAANCPPESVEIHASGKTFQVINDDGKLEPHPVHGFVLWRGSETRGVFAKQAIAQALVDFLREHGIGTGFDLTFFDMPAESFFMESFGQIHVVPGVSISKSGPYDGDFLG